MEIGILIEGQDGLTWPRWKNLAQACLDLGFCGLFRSDHFTHAPPPDFRSDGDRYSHRGPGRPDLAALEKSGPGLPRSRLLRALSLRPLHPRLSPRSQRSGAMELLDLPRRSDSQTGLRPPG